MSNFKIYCAVQNCGEEKSSAASPASQLSKSERKLSAAFPTPFPINLFPTLVPPILRKKIISQQDKSEHLKLPEYP